MIYRFKEYVGPEIISGHLNMGGKDAHHREISANSLYFTADGKPFIGVMGEYHYVRDDPDAWLSEIRKMKAGGVNIVSTYVMWNYHEETEGEFDFSQNKDIRRFARCVLAEGLELCLRIGPWINAECRNGALPDWLFEKQIPVRTNDAEYLKYVRRFWEKLYEQVRDIPLMALQIENELVDRSEHILTLKNTALSIGFRAPLYTATGWNRNGGAKLPLDEVLPVFGGYPEAPWENHREKLEPSVHYFFTGVRNDAEIGADLMVLPNDDGWRLPYERYPFATCEMGGGIQIGHLRRPIIRPMDVYALSLVKLGCGNNLIGYYMFHGGTNGLGRYSTMNVSWCPVRNYDFQAPVSQYGEIRASYRYLNLINLFAADFGEMLAPMPMCASEAFVPRDDKQLLRYVMRTDGESGFVFVNHYQRLDRLKEIKGAVIDTGKVVFPPLDIVSQSCFSLPFNLKLGNVVLTYATTQPLCRMEDCCFFFKIDDADPVYRFADGTVYAPNPGYDSAFTKGGMNFITLSLEQALHARKIDGKLYICETEDLIGSNGGIEAASGNGTFTYQVWEDGGFKTHERKDGNTANAKNAILSLVPCGEQFAIPEQFLTYLNMGHERKINWFRMDVDSDAGFVEIADRYDVGQIYIDGVLAADNFYYGEPWRIPSALIYGKKAYFVCSEYEGDFYREF